MGEDYYWVSYPIDFTKRNFQHILGHREGSISTIGSIYKREGKFYFGPKIKHIAYTPEWSEKMLEDVLATLREVNAGGTFGKAEEHATFGSFSTPWDNSEDAGETL